jgi:hypothetical protein
MSTDPQPCPGSGLRPAEMVILDTVPGMDPRGTCPICDKSLTLKMYRLPEHDNVKRAAWRS